MALVSSFCVQATARDIPAVADIDWKCEEGVGNLDHPAPLIRITGVFNTAPSREFSLSEKQGLRVFVYVDGEPVALNPLDYKAIWYNDGDFQSLVIETKGVTYKIGTTPGNALILKVIRPGWFGGTKTQVGSC